MHNSRSNKTATATAFPVTPPAYHDIYCSGDERSWKRPKSWPKRCWITVVAVVVLILIIAIIIAVEVTKANRYPDYTQLSYSLSETYSGESFFDNFDYFTGYDPASGLVHYVDEAGSTSLNLTYASSSSAILRVDTSITDTTTGRKSVRIESKQTYSDGLFIFDVLHSPYGCSTWPALWMANRNYWPTDGEIDIMESTNTASVGNQVTLHTTEGCTMKSVKRKQTGTTVSTDCYNGTNSNEGCGVSGPTTTIGETFNTNGGGVYAVELRDAGIRTWFFSRSSIPADVASVLSNNGSSTTPDPSTWPEALADFPSTDCDISTHFQNITIIANIDLCGQLAGLTKLFNTQSGCSGTCVDYVMQQAGTVYEDAYWEFGGWWVYQSS